MRALSLMLVLATATAWETRASPVAPAPAPAPPSGQDPLDLSTAAGHAVARRLCSRCHAVEASGDSPNPDSPAFRMLTGQFVPLTLQRRLTEISETGHYDMPPVTVHADEIDDLAAYINSFGDAWRGDDRPDTPR
jgi:mono/diheme cytochrome c family protein